MCLVKIEIHRVRIMAQRSTYEICGLLSVIIIRLDEFINAHVRLESGLYAIEVIECISGKFFHGYIVILFVRLVNFLNGRFQMTDVTTLMKSYTSKELQIIVVPLAIDRFSFQTDDGFILLNVCRQGIHANAPNWIIYDFINKMVIFVSNSHTHCESVICLNAHCKMSFCFIRPKKTSKSPRSLMRLGSSRYRPQQLQEE